MLLILLLRRIFHRKIKLSDEVRTKSRVSYPKDSPLMLHKYSHQHGMMVMQPLEPKKKHVGEQKG